MICSPLSGLGRQSPGESPTGIAEPPPVRNPFSGSLWPIKKPKNKARQDSRTEYKRFYGNRVGQTSSGKSENTMKKPFKSILPALLLLALPAAVQAQWVYTSDGSTITITGYTCKGYLGALIIPDTINELPVTTIASQAFYRCNLGTVKRVGIQ
jgi:hypothetical protein